MCPYCDQPYGTSGAWAHADCERALAARDERREAERQDAARRRRVSCAVLWSTARWLAASGLVVLFVLAIRDAVDSITKPRPPAETHEPIGFVEPLKESGGVVSRRTRMLDSATFTNTNGVPVVLTFIGADGREVARHVIPANGSLTLPQGSCPDYTETRTERAK